MNQSVLPLGQFFQFGYVTRDIERAIALFGARHGLTKFSRIQAPPFAPPRTQGAKMTIASAYKGELMIEIICPPEGGEAFYADALRDDGGVALHHLGYMIDEETFARLPAALAAQGVETTIQGGGAESLLYLYADTRADTGLFSEYICLGEGGRRSFARVPRN